MVKLYPFGVLLIGVVLNFTVLDLAPLIVSLPGVEQLSALVLAASLLILNHTWLMTATELTRIRFDMFATPEEWAANSADPKGVSDKAARELERHHNAHRNTTENSLYFGLLAAPFILVSPPVETTYVWLVGFACARIGYTYSYLYGKDGLRGVFMSLNLIALYGLASYLIMVLW